MTGQLSETLPDNRPLGTLEPPDGQPPPLGGCPVVRCPGREEKNLSGCPVGVLPSWMPPRATCHRGCPFLDLVVGLVGLGYAPVPLGPEKRPLVKWGSFHVTPPTWADLYNRFPWAEAVGVGLITGRPHGLVVVDADDARAGAGLSRTCSRSVVFGHVAGATCTSRTPAAESSATARARRP